MQKGIRLGIVKAVITLLALSCSLAARATAYVEVSFDYGFSPSTVNISEGEAVYWSDGDDWGPYRIVIQGIGYLDTPGGYRFNTAGNYTCYNDYGDFGYVNVSASVPNSPPVVTITSPTNNSVFTAPASFAFEVDASDPDPYPNELWDVEFWVGSEMVDDVYSAPYATTVTNLPAGTYTLKAIAWDYAYETATNSITIRVVNPITLTASAIVGGKFRFDANGLVPGRSTVLQASTNLASAASWIPISTNVVAGSTASFTNAAAAGRRFYRIVQLP
jgi:hypothetical protein